MNLSPRRVVLTEYGPPFDRQMPDDVGVALGSTGFVDATRLPGTAVWTLRATSKGGHASGRSAGGDGPPEGAR
jgi:hypothetical protein